MKHIVPINEGWAFVKGCETAPAAIPTGAARVDLPHCWNALDGQDGGSDYWRGPCCYLKTIEKPAGKNVYVEVEAASSVGKIIVNGVEKASHKGGYSLFRANVTDALHDGENLLAIWVDNTQRDDVYPQTADFTFYGGLYRGVNLITVEDSRFDLDYCGGKGFDVSAAVEDGAAVVEAPDGKATRIEADKLLLSIGRRADFAGLGLETLGVEVQKTGVITDAMGRTNVPGVYAVGDVNGHHMLAHTAYREAEVAVNDMLGKRDSMRYYANPSVIYTCPEIASVGRTEEEAREKGIDYEVRKLSMRYSGRFVAENEGADGLCKVLIHRKKRTIIGVHMIGAYCGEIIWGAAEMIEMQLRVEDARQIIFPHPTVSEIIREALWLFDD